MTRLEMSNTRLHLDLDQMREQIHSLLYICEKI